MGTNNSIVKGDKAFQADPNCPVPRFIAAADLAINRLKDQFDAEHPCAIVFFGQKFLHKNMPYEYHRCAAFGPDKDVIQTLAECFEMQPSAFELVTRAWWEHFLYNTPADTRDDALRDARRAILRVLKRGEHTPDRLPQEQADDIFLQVQREHPDREDQIRVLQAKLKQHRKAGLKDICLYLEQAIFAVQDAKHEAEQDLIARRDNAIEAQRCRVLRREEAALDNRLQHDYDSLTRRVRSYRTMIERLTSEMEQLQQEQRDLQQQHPQFDPHSAAKRRRQQLAERKRERNARKKKGKEGVIDNVGSCSQMLRKIV